MTDITTDTPTDEPLYNPFAEGFAEYPYDQYAALRAQDPVHRTMIGGVYVSMYEDVFTLLRDNSLSVEDRHAAPTPLDDIVRDALGDDSIFEDRDASMLARDAPDHTRLRKLVSRAFTPRRINELRPRIQEIVDASLAEAEETGTIEAIGTLAFPLPFEVITEMLGMPEQDTDRIRDVSGTIVRSLEPVMDPDVLRAIRDAGMEMNELLEAAITWKRANPADDLLTLLIDAEEDGDTLTDAELNAQLGLLFVAGHETTVNLIGNGLLALARNPDQAALLREQPDLIDNAIEEFLRYDPPVQNSRRIPLRDTEVRGVTVEKGSFMICGLASANRDEAHFGPDAGSVDITRANAREHLAFGGGSHYCLGASLAKLEAIVAIGTLVQRFPKLELAAEPVYNGRINLRGLDRLELTLR